MKLVGLAGIEPATTCVSCKHSASELQAHGGVGGTRTPYLLIANEMFSQVNYDPMTASEEAGQ